MKLPTPQEIASELLNNAFLTEDQANTIAAELYQPLRDKLNNIENALIVLSGSSDISNGIRSAALDELYRPITS